MVQVELLLWISAEMSQNKSTRLLLHSEQVFQQWVGRAWCPLKQVGGVKASSGNSNAWPQGS